MRLISYFVELFFLVGLVCGFLTLRGSSRNFARPHNVKFETARLLGREEDPLGNITMMRKINNVKIEPTEMTTTSVVENKAKLEVVATPINEICKRDNHIIQRSEDLHQLQLHCPEVIGNVIIVPDYPDALGDLGSIIKINGNLVIHNTSAISKVKAENLKYITGAFIMGTLTSLVTLDVPNLVSVNAIEWNVLPILNFAELNPRIVVTSHIIISDTSLSYIDAFQNIKELEILSINNNRFLETIKTNIVKVHQLLTIHANARDVQLEMPQLMEAENLTIRDTSYIHLPKLEVVYSSFEVIENLVTELNVPNLRFVGGTLGIIENINLAKADFNNVTEIQGGLMIANNNKLDRIDFFQNLKQIGGAIHFEGTFQDTVFDNLKLVKGSAFISSKSNNLDCNKWTSPPNGRSIIRGGKVKCSSPRKQKFLNVDKDGKVLESLESNIPLAPSKDGKNQEPLQNGERDSNSSSATTQNMTLLFLFLFGLVMIF